MHTIHLLRDVLLEANELDKYFEGRVPATLWRARNKRGPDDVFGLVEEETIRPSGAVRPADITIEDGPDGRKWVCVKPKPRGASTFDKPGVFKGKGWEYYRINAGTELPHGVAIVKDYFNTAYGAYHYTIAPAWDMPLEQFKRLLATLAQKLVKEVG